MTRIVHLSDLHFGFHREDLVAPLLQQVNRLCPDIVVVTGDLTHRGRPGQYRQAAKFLDRITAPVMAVPGNHDVPLYNIPVRFLTPWAGYRQAISPDLQPTRAAGGVRVLGLNSVDPFAWQRGVIRRGEVGRLIGGLDPQAINVVALHHPLQQLPKVDKELARRAPSALTRLEAAGVGVALTGHLHHWAAAALLDMGHPHILQVQGGTALCARADDPANEFAVLDFAGPRLSIQRHIAERSGNVFNTIKLLCFSLGKEGWSCLDSPDNGCVV